MMDAVPLLLVMSGGIVLIDSIFFRTLRQQCALRTRALKPQEHSRSSRTTKRARSRWPIKFLRASTQIQRAAGRQASHPVFGETASPGAFNKE